MPPTATKRGSPVIPHPVIAALAIAVATRVVLAGVIWFAAIVVLGLLFKS